MFSLVEGKGEKWWDNQMDNNTGIKKDSYKISFNVQIKKAPDNKIMDYSGWFNGFKKNLSCNLFYMLTKNIFCVWSICLDEQVAWRHYPYL